MDLIIQLDIKIGLPAPYARAVAPSIGFLMESKRDLTLEYESPKFSDQ